MNSRAQGLHSPRDTVPAKMQDFLQAMLIAKPYRGDCTEGMRWLRGTEVCYFSLKQNIKYMVSRSLVLEHLNFDPFVYLSNIEDCSPMIDPPKSLKWIYFFMYTIFCVAFISLS